MTDMKIGLYWKMEFRGNCFEFKDFFLFVFWDEKERIWVIPKSHLEKRVFGWIKWTNDRIFAYEYEKKIVFSLKQFMELVNWYEIHVRAVNFVTFLPGKSFDILLKECCKFFFQVKLTRNWFWNYFLWNWCLYNLRSLRSVLK